MDMSEKSEEVRNVALSLVNSAGMKCTRVGRGQKFVVDIDDGHNTKRALVKTAAKGGAMVYASSVDKNAEISGFDSGLDSVLFCACNPDTDLVDAFLVPLAEAEEAYRSKSRHSPRKAGGAMWIIGFYDTGEPWNGFAEKWQKYKIRTSNTASSTAIPRLEVRPLTIEQAKAGLAAQYKVNPEAIKITMEW